MQISKTLKEIATIAEQFETHKISDFKEILTNFILIKMKYHASCLEVLTMVHEDVAGINEKDDSQVSVWRVSLAFHLTLWILLVFLHAFKGFLGHVKKVNRVQSFGELKWIRLNWNLNSSFSQTEIQKTSPAKRQTQLQILSKPI